MTTRRGPAAAAALVCAAAAAGCGFGPGPSSEGTATLTVTRDYGSTALVDAAEDDPPSSETVIRFLDREAEITTRYGGGFVQSIDGLAGTESGGRRYDWFFYVNGIESAVGAAEVHVQGGDRIWWDYRDWTDAMRVPRWSGRGPSRSRRPRPRATTGRCESSAWPAAAPARPPPIASPTPGSRRASSAGRERGRASAAALRLLVGPWSEVRDDRAVDGLRGGPAANGVFATFKGPIDGAYHLIALDPTAAPARDLGPDCRAWWPRCKAAIRRRPGSSPGRDARRCAARPALSTPRRCETAMRSPPRPGRRPWGCRSSARRPG